MPNLLPYDASDKYSILTYAMLLKEKSLRSILEENIDESTVNKIGKGGFGNMVEELYFGYKPNSDAQPDFPEAGIELKTTPIKTINKGFVSKERLVFNIINYLEEHKEVFRTSSFWKKNSELLLMFYLHEQEKMPLDYIFKIIRLWRFPETDLKIIIDDWNVIVGKIKAGKAHEISEGDTLYLGACTKGANKGSLRKQPFSDELAMQRAYSLKSKYLNFIIEQSLANVDHKIDEGLYDYLLSETRLSREQYEEYKRINIKDIGAIVNSVHDYSEGQTFEDLVISKFNRFIGYSEIDLIEFFDLDIDKKAKNRYNIICNRIMGISGKYSEEFLKADIEMKTIVVEKRGNIKESMSFQQIKFKEIIHEDWLNSYWYNVLTKRFFFVIFQRDEQNIPRLKKVMFWTMPQKDLEIAEYFWEHTQKKIQNDEFDSFIKISDNMICHVRPKAKDSKDLMETASGKLVKKKAYWLNSSYIKDIMS
jgi:DNA mismatch repair protein MutH